jgi:hypothetical protein
MAVGVWFHVTEHHELSTFTNPWSTRIPTSVMRIIQHEHDPNDPPGEPHTHAHRHGRLKHTHPHVPDMHHKKKPELSTTARSSIPSAAVVLQQVQKPLWCLDQQLITGLPILCVHNPEIVRWIVIEDRSEK